MNWVIEFTHLTILAFSLFHGLDIFYVIYMFLNLFLQKLWLCMGELCDTYLPMKMCLIKCPFCCLLPVSFVSVTSEINDPI